MEEKLKLAVLSMLLPLPRFYAQELYDAIQARKTDHLIEILASLSLKNIVIISEAYALCKIITCTITMKLRHSAELLHGEK